MVNVRDWRKLIDIGLLFASKSGGIIVGIFILPWYQNLLGASEFGVVATVLSFQGFLLMLDFGASTQVGRDIAASHNAKHSLVTWRAAELLLHITYAGLTFLALFVNIILNKPLENLQVVLCLILFWSLTIQNVGQSALLAKRLFALAGSIQVIGVLSRATITLIALIYISAEVQTFLIAQALISVAQMVVTSLVCSKSLNKKNLSYDKVIIRERTLDLFRMGIPLLVFGISGAAVLQLDKVIISFINSPAALAPYYLAGALCLTPISILAGPVNQYYYPSIIQSISDGKSNQTLIYNKRLIVSIILAVMIPSTLIWLNRDAIIGLWLHEQVIRTEVEEYVKILLPGVALGSLGFVPYNMLVAKKDYRVHAILSTCMTIITLLATTVAAASGSVIAVCWIYSCYHIISVIVIWWRACIIANQKYDSYALQSAKFVSVFILAFAVIASITSFIL